MKQKLNYLTIAILVVFSLVLLIGVVSAAEQIRPAPQTESRGVGEQIRPANQQNLPSDGNGNYQPTEGADYSSSVNVAPKPVSDSVKMQAILNSTNLNQTSNTTGTGLFVLNKTANTLSYNITYTCLSSNETASEISIPGLIINNQTVSFSLPLGEVKQGILSFVEEVKNYIIEGKAFIKIKSLLFPTGEIGGEIKAV